MKRVLLFVITMLILSLIIGCATELKIGDNLPYQPKNGNQNAQTTNYDESEMQVSSVLVANDFEYAELTICEGTLTNSGATIMVENKSVDCFIYYSSIEYGLEKAVNGSWYRVPPTVTTRSGAAISEAIRPTLSRNWNIDWSSFYGELEDGEYRLVLNIEVFENVINEAGEIDNKMKAVGEYYLSVEFSII